MDPFVVQVKFDAANAPILKKSMMKFKSDVRIMDVIQLLKGKLNLESVVLVVEKCFVPLADQSLGELYSSFARNEKLHITYGLQAVFG